MTDAAARPLLSLVIPVYNAASYLGDLIESLLRQRLLPDEVIFVDDGSTDASFEIISKRCAGLAGLQIIRQENQGQAVARNVGIRHATGRYLAFLDADDFVAPDLYSTLVDLAESERLDVVMCNAWNFYEGRKPDTLLYRNVADTGVISGESWLQQRWLSKYLPHYCWLQICRRSFIDELGLSFPIADPHEDVVWLTEILLAARRFHFIPTPLYFFSKKVKELSTPLPAILPEERVRPNKVIESGLYNTQALARIAQRQGLQPLTRRLMRKDFVNGGCNVIRNIRQFSDAAQRAYYLQRVREGRFVLLLWRNAAGLSQYWRVLRYHLLSYL
ncbi:MAG: glycosyltransferase [Pseudomonadota bacterium]